MKKVILLLIFMPLPAFCQISENFENGSISGWTQSTEGRWSADMSSPVAGLFSLHHIYDNPDAGYDQAGIPVVNLRLKSGTTKWTFMVKHGYDPSSSNNWAFFLAADNGPSDMKPGGRINGYAAGVNFTGSDDTLRIWKIKQGIPSVVVSSKVNWQNNIGITSPATVQVERSPEGVWTVSVLYSSGTLSASSTATDNEIFPVSWAGIYYKYSSTRDRVLWLDNINVEGAFIADSTAPVVKKITVSGRNSLIVELDEETAGQFSKSSNFTIGDELNEASEVIKLTPFSCLLTFDREFDNLRINTLTIKTICDIYGNCSENISYWFTPVWARAGDVVISEIMADPFPPVSLPGEEYIELKNNTLYSFNLDGWKLISEGHKVLFPESEIGAGESLIICHVNDTSLFSGYGRVTGLKTFPVLNDDGKWIVLCDSTGKMIHGIEYSKSWYGNKLKSEGGWSLEIIDSSHPFNHDGNWKASVSRAGGTPGKANSVDAANPDRSFKGITNVFPVDEKTLLISFSEPVMNISELYASVKITGSKPVDAWNSDYLGRKIIIGISNSLQPAMKYNLVIPDALCDYSGNRIEKRNFTFGLPQVAGRGELVFNEILFNPEPGLHDFIELMNVSGKTFDASNLYLVSVNDLTSDTSSMVAVSDEPRCILPGAVYAITTGRESLIERYVSATDTNIYEVGELPSMSDSEGHLILYNRQLDLIDEVKYSAEMHYSLLSGTEGISLEKISPDLNSFEPKNWHSASEASGWATPGTPNSTVPVSQESEDQIVFSSTRITPDNDGYEDVLAIGLNLEGLDNIISVTIFDERGRFVRKLAENLLAGSHATLTWDGTASDFSLVGSGIYIFYITLYDASGKSAKWKRVCAVIR
jgi:hypothetical protein